MVQFIEAGSTTREEVILNLGQPDVVARNQTLFVYVAERVVSFWAVYGGYATSGGKGRAHWYLVIEFDQDGTVERYGEATRSSFFQFCPCYYCTVSGICIPYGLRRVVLAPANEDSKAKEFFPHPAKCTIYLYHDASGWANPNFDVPVYLNGRHAGSTYSGGYFLWKVDPGRIKIMSKSPEISSLVFECEARKTYFIRQVIPYFAGKARIRHVLPDIVGLTAVELQLVDKSVGQKGVRRRKFILGKF